MPQNKHANDLAEYRRRIRLTQAEVAILLGRRDHRSISRLEVGKNLPNLKTALALAALYRVPTDFLFSRTYRELRDGLRHKEAQLKYLQSNVAR